MLGLRNSLTSRLVGPLTAVATNGLKRQNMARLYATESAGEKHVKTTFDSNSGVATLEMCRAPVNSLNLEFLTEMSIALEKLDNNKACRGIILTSGCRNVFSAGLDIFEMYQGKRERMSEFWRTLQQVWLQLYGSRCVIMAAINGHAPAGGALLAMTCDYRAMVKGKYTIGLNETLLGIVAPFWFKDTMLNTVGHRRTEMSLALGTLYSAEDALKIGMVDWLGDSPDSVMEHCREEMDKWLSIPDMARMLSKQMMRKPTIDNMISKREADIETFVGFVSKESIQQQLGVYVEMMKARQKAKL